MEKGKFIALEGIDGCGKSTQGRLLSEYLRSKGVDCVLTREPTDSPFGSLIRQCLKGQIDTDEKAIAALFAADRLDHIFNKRDGILEKINGGVTVLTDRYYFSSYAYHGTFMPMDWVIEANRFSAEALRPDLNIFLDIEPERSAARLSRRGTLERYEKVEAMKRIREKYFEAFEKLKDSERVCIIRSEENPEDTQANIRAAVDKLFQKA